MAGGEAKPSQVRDSQWMLLKRVSRLIPTILTAWNVMLCYSTLSEFK